MMRAFRSAVILIVAVLVVAGGTVYFQRSSDSKAKAEAPSAHGKHEGEGGVELSDAKIAAAGIELEKAGPGVLHEHLFVNGILQPNQETFVQVTPRFPGIMREINRRTGDRVEKGDLLAKIESNQSLTVYELRAPLSGTIIERQFALGEYVGEQKYVFTVADLSNVWVNFSIYRRDLNRVRMGDRVLLDPEDGGSPVETAIAYISPVGNSDTQSVLARGIVDNKDLRLRPGMFVSGRVLLGAKPVALVVKSSALQTVENRAVVFVRVGDKFEPREVEIGDRDRDNVEIAFGLMEGDVYATKNSFIIKAELAKGSASHEH
jgi:cobalt-zinc-cadmium efflux system membrane fusion protein